MSFFYDVFNYFNLSDCTDSSLISYIPGVGVVLYGDYKIDVLSDVEIIVIKNNKKLIFTGLNLLIKSMSKGEIVIEGDVRKINGESDE